MRTTITLITCCLCINSFAQTRLSVDEAINFALRNNAGIKAAAFEAESQRELKKTSFDLPKTDVTLLYGKYNSYAIDNNTTISQSIPFTALGSQGKLNRSLAAAAEIRKASTQNELIFQIKQTYYQLAFVYAKNKLLVKQDSIFEGFYKAASLRYKAGETKLLEQTTAEMQRNEIKNQIRQNEGVLSALQTELGSLLNSNAIIEIADTVLNALEFKLALDTVSYLSNPALAYSQQQIVVSESQKRVEAAKFAPDVIVGYFNQTLIGTPNFESTPATKSNRFSGLQVGVSFPLWFVPHQARVKAAEFNKKAAESNYNNFQISLRAKLKQAIQQYIKNKSSLEYYQTSALPSADLILKQSQSAFKGGDIGYAEYLLGLRNVITIQEVYLQTLNDYNQSIIYIEYLSGNK